MLREIIKPIHIIIATVFVLGLILFAVIMKTYEAANPVVIKKVPSDATLLVDGKQINGGRTDLSNGTYTVKAERSGFNSTTFTTLITDDVKYIAVTLTPSSDEARKWAEDNQNAYLELERFVGSTTETSGQTLAAKNPIVTSLPLSDFSYSVGYVKDPKDTSGTSIILTVHALDGYWNAAIRSIYDAGYNPADYTITLNKLSNPFAEDNK